jgi:hypothetical protein
MELCRDLLSELIRRFGYLGFPPRKKETEDEARSSSVRLLFVPPF